MKIIIIGATGGTGHQAVVQALAAGHEVTAPVRTPNAMSIQHARLRVVRADVIEAQSLREAFAGGEAVVSSLGIGGFFNNLRPTTVYSQGTRHILEAMQFHRIRRFVGVTSEGVDDNPTKGFVYGRIIRPLLMNTYVDMGRMEAEVKASGLDWTIVRPSGLLDQPATGKYRVAVNARLEHPGSIGRADVAGFLLKALGDNRSIGTVVDVAS